MVTFVNILGMFMNILKGVIVELILLLLLLSAQTENTHITSSSDIHGYVQIFGGYGKNYKASYNVEHEVEYEGLILYGDNRLNNPNEATWNLSRNWVYDTLIGGEGDDTMIGYFYDDIMKGRGGNDTMDGGQHDDTIIGGRGNDTITGNRGRDTFVYTSVDDGDDTITDFEINNHVMPDGRGNYRHSDTLDLSQLLDYDSDTDDINDYLSFYLLDNGDTLIKINADGEGLETDVTITLSDFTIPRNIGHIPNTLVNMLDKANHTLALILDDSDSQLEGVETETIIEVKPKTKIIKPKSNWDFGHNIGIWKSWDYKH